MPAPRAWDGISETDEHAEADENILVYLKKVLQLQKDTKMQISALEAGQMTLLRHFSCEESITAPPLQWFRGGGASKGIKVAPTSGLQKHMQDIGGGLSQPPKEDSAHIADECVATIEFEDSTSECSEGVRISGSTDEGEQSNRVSAVSDEFNAKDSDDKISQWSQSKTGDSNVGTRSDSKPSWAGSEDRSVGGTPIAAPKRLRKALSCQFEEADEKEDTHVAICRLHPRWQQAEARNIMNYCSSTKRLTVDYFRNSSHQSQAWDTLTRTFSKSSIAHKKARMRTDTLDRFVLSPSSELLFVWCLVEALLLTYDMIAIPASLLNPPATVFDDVIKWISLIFWTVDMPVSCFKGFITRYGDLEMTFRKVAKQYLRYNFTVDFFLIIIEYVNFLMWQFKADEDVATTGRFLRMLRFSRLLKVGKIRRLLARLLGQVSSTSVLAVIYNFGELLLIVYMCHAGACIWYLIGESHTEALPSGTDGSLTNRRWLTYEKSTTFTYRYVTCLHWAMSQLGYGGIDIFPTNTAERIYACVFTMLCLVSVLLWTAALVSSMMHLYTLSKSDRQLSDQLRDC
jgi:hypothetical protein